MARIERPKAGQITITKATVPPGLLKVGEHCVYRFLDKGGRCIYIGRTGQPYTRWQAHARKEWFRREVFAIEYERGLTEVQARAVENAALREERPKYDGTFKR